MDNKILVLCPRVIWGWTLTRFVLWLQSTERAEHSGLGPFHWGPIQWLGMAGEKAQDEIRSDRVKTSSTEAEGG